MGSKRNSKDVIGLGTQRSTNTAFAGNGASIIPTNAVIQTPETKFVIRLVHLDSAALASLTKGQSVYIDLGSESVAVTTLQGRRIGDVPSADVDRVREHGASGGVIVDLSVKEPAFVAVRVG